MHILLINDFSRSPHTPSGNTIGWLAYSYITLDLFVFFANAPGVCKDAILMLSLFYPFNKLIELPCVSFQLMISIWLNVGAMKLQYYEETIKYSSIQSAEGRVGESAEEENENDTQSSNGEGNNNDVNLCQTPPPSLTSHELKVLQIVIIWLVILSVTSLIPISKDGMKSVVGVAVNLNLIFFYAAPLSTIMTVLRTKSSSTIHVWTMVMNTVNAFFWCIYSLAIQDYYILIPNGLGFLFGILQMVMFMIYRQSDIIDGDGTAQFLDEDGNSKARDSQMDII